MTKFVVDMKVVVDADSMDSAILKTGVLILSQASVAPTIDVRGMDVDLTQLIATSINYIEDDYDGRVFIEPVDLFDAPRTLQ